MTFKIVKFFFYLLLAFLGGCASVMRLPTTSPFRSENVGGNAATIESQFGTAARLQAASDYRDTPINGPATAFETNTLDLHGFWGLNEFFDTYWQWNVGGSNVVGLKFQAVWPNLREGKSGDFSLSMAAGFGLYVAGGESAAGTTLVTRKYITEYASPQGEITIGIRPFNPVLISLGVYYSRFTHNVSFSEGSREEFKLRGNQTIFHLSGTLTSGVVLATIDVGQSKLTYGSRTNTDLSNDLNAGHIW